MTQQKLLVVRLSSFGDILHGLSIPTVFKNTFPESEVHWVVRSDFSELLDNHDGIDRIWAFKKESGLRGWLSFIRKLRAEKFTHIYDAHNNLRSSLLVFYFFSTFFSSPFRFARRSKSRFKRFLLFNFRINLFPKPYRSQRSFLEPLGKWGLQTEVPSEAQLKFSEETKNRVRPHLPSTPFIALSPSAAWPMKRWPIDKWKELIKKSDKNFVILGGPQDNFCQDIADVAPERCTNLAGKLKLIESCAAVHFSEQLISADTGLLHAADLMGKNNIALIGPTAFGYPSHKNSTVLESNLSCQPCSKDGRGRCKQKIFQKCMVDIQVSQVLSRLL